MRVISIYFLILFLSTSAIATNSTKLSCHFANAATEINNKLTPTAWGIWSIVYGVLPVISEIVIAVLLSKLVAPQTEQGPGQQEEPIQTIVIVNVNEVVNNPTAPTGIRIGLGIANLLRARNANGIAAAGAGGAAPSGLSAQDIITILMFVFSSAAYATQKFMQAQCDSES